MMLRIRPTIILFGDSITQQGFSVAASTTATTATDTDTTTTVTVEQKPGWVGLLSNTYTRRADVLNRGFSGYNTRHAIDMLPFVFGEDAAIDGDGTPTLMVAIFFGANDAALPGKQDHPQHVPIDEYEENLRTIVKTIR